MNQLRSNVNNRLSDFISDTTQPKTVDKDVLRTMDSSQESFVDSEGSPEESQDANKGNRNSTELDGAVEWCPQSTSTLADVHLGPGEVVEITAEYESIYSQGQQIVYLPISLKPSEIEISYVPDVDPERMKELIDLNEYLHRSENIISLIPTARKSRQYDRSKQTTNLDLVTADTLVNPEQDDLEIESKEELPGTEETFWSHWSSESSSENSRFIDVDSMKATPELIVTSTHEEVQDQTRRHHSEDDECLNMSRNKTTSTESIPDGLVLEETPLSQLLSARTIVNRPEPDVLTIVTSSGEFTAASQCHQPLMVAVDHRNNESRSQEVLFLSKNTPFTAASDDRSRTIRVNGEERSRNVDNEDDYVDQQSIRPAKKKRLKFPPIDDEKRDQLARLQFPEETIVNVRQFLQESFKRPTAIDPTTTGDLVKN